VKSPARVAVFAGPSGGHLFPAAAFAEAWKRRHSAAQLFLITSEKARPLTEALTPGIFSEIYYLHNFPSAPGISLRSMSFLLKLPRAFIESYRFISKVQPELSIGFGSYVSFPGILWSVWKRIPTLIHEQNQVPGKATRWLASRVDMVAVSFEATLQKLKVRQGVVTGLPLRSRFERPAARSDSRERYKILVVGGSQGAAFLNRCFRDAVTGFEPEEKARIAVTHITGAGDFEQVSGYYREAGIEAEVHPFFERMEDLYEAADMAVSRAGANTLFELALFRLPAVIIPYPFADGHQVENARYFEAAGGFLVREQQDLTSAGLRDLIRNLMQDPERRQRMKERLALLAAPEAPEKLVDLAEQVCRRSHP